MRMFKMICIAVVISVLILLASGCEKKESIEISEYSNIDGERVRIFDHPTNDNYECFIYGWGSDRLMSCIPKKGVNHGY